MLSGFHFRANIMFQNCPHGATHSERTGRAEPPEEQSACAHLEGSVIEEDAWECADQPVDRADANGGQLESIRNYAN